MTNEQNEFFNVEHLSKSTRVSAPTVSFSWRRAARARVHTSIEPERKEKKRKKTVSRKANNAFFCEIRFDRRDFSTLPCPATTVPRMLIATRRLMRGGDGSDHPYPIVRREPVAADVAPPTGKRTIFDRFR